MISIDDFKNIDIRAGAILSADIVPDADKLLKLSVDLGEETPRSIVSGIREAFPDPSVLLGKQYLFATNLEPRTIRGIPSNGMILALRDSEGAIVLLTPERPVLPGTRAM